MTISFNGRLLSQQLLFLPSFQSRAEAVGHITAAVCNPQVEYFSIRRLPASSPSALLSLLSGVGHNPYPVPAVRRPLGASWKNNRRDRFVTFALQISVYLVE
jgi:hypothetical protein